MYRILTCLAALFLLGASTEALAMGSDEKKPEAGDEKKPGVAREVKAYNKGVKAMKSGKLEKAQKAFEDALEAKEDFPEAHNNLGYCLRKQGAKNFDEALEHYNRALELKPELAEAYMYRGVLFLQKGEADKAKADLETLQKLSPKLAAELQRVIDSGQEKDAKEYYGLIEARD